MNIFKFNLHMTGDINIIFSIRYNDFFVKFLLSYNANINSYD